MNPWAAFGVGVGVGVVLTGITLVSLAPNIAERVVLRVASGAGSDIGLPSAVTVGVARPLARAVRVEVARKVAPWAL